MGVFIQGQFKLLALTEREWEGIMVWSKWHHCQCSGDGMKEMMKKGTDPEMICRRFWIE